MVDVLRRKLEGVVASNVEVVQAGFLSYEHSGGPVDFVSSRNALHQLPDLWKAIALQRVHDLLKPGGVLRLRDLVFDFDPDEADERLAAWVAGAVDDPTRGFTGPELEAHLRDEFSTWSWLFEPMLERVGFEILEAQYVRSAYGAYTCRRS
jgi:SAM-dependent methyltransferase